MTRKTAPYYRILTLAAVALLTVVLAGSAMAEVGFQARLHVEPPVVSLYDSPLNQFSAAIRPLTILRLHRSMIFAPTLGEVSFDQHSLRFETKYHGEAALVPVSVDADEYLSYRNASLLRINSQKSFSQSIIDAQKSNKRQGLSIGVALPKRFDKVFGEGGGNLRVSGYRRITFAGRSQWTDGKSELLTQSKFPSLNMEQIYRFDIDGTIGTKISVKVSEDSKTDIPLENRIQIRYKGDDDDILKVIEAGNTNLSLPNTRFVGYSSRIQGLFGVKAEAQMGNFRVIGIASQEKGSSEKASISASGEESAEYIRDYQYVEGRVFDLGYTEEFVAGDSVVNLYVYEYESRTENREALNARLYIYGDSVDSDGTIPLETQKEEMRMVQLDEESYSFFNEPRNNLHYVYFNSARSRTNALGVWMVVKRAGGTVDTVGNLRGDTLILKALRSSPSSYRYGVNKTWDLMWRNVYHIPKGVAAEDIDLKIFKGLPKTETSTSNLDYQDKDHNSQGNYIEILGLDQYDRADQPNPDKILDNNWDVFRPDWGVIIFPSRRPFDDTVTFGPADDRTVQLAERVPELYDFRSEIEKTENSKYYIQIATKTRSSIIRLNRANIIEGSEQVTLNGNQLRRDVDYTIDYDFGQVTLLSPDATDPNAALDIDFEYAPFLALQKKTLFGMRADYEWSEDLKFGSTILYKSDKAQDRKPKVGQETAKMTVMDFNLDFNLHPNFLTSVVNAIPLVATESPSNITVSAEVAQSRPNPNVDDVAYVDDFESANDQLTLGTARGGWTMASWPEQIDRNSYQRAKMIWHNPPERVDARDVYNREYAAGEGTITTFRMVFRPNPLKLDTVYNETDTTIIDRVDTTRMKSWGGMMRYFGNRVDAKRAQLFETRVKGGKGRLHFDFGIINEDVNGNGTADSEDGGQLGNNNGTVDLEEDVGLDGVPDSLEAGYNSVTNPDPAGDNWYYDGVGKCPFSSGCDHLPDSMRFDYLNGTEGNYDDIGHLGLPDMEKLSPYSFQENNAYFSFVVELGDEEFMVPRTGDSLVGDTTWHTYRIPIRDSLKIDTTVETAGLSANWANISHVRVWFEADEETNTPETLLVAAWYFVQSNWQDSIVVYPYEEGNTEFVVATVSEDEGTFTAPPGVEAYEDNTTNVTEAQRGLALMYKQLRSKDSCLATKDLISVESYSGYRNLEMYVHGDDARENDSVIFLFRLGQNDSTYYQYVSPTCLYPGWDERNYVNVDFNEITVLKDSLQRNIPEGKTFAEIDTVIGSYGIRGDPNLNEIRYFAAGVVNPDSTQEVTGEVWVDELRVTSVRKDVGNAGRVSVNGNLADLLSYTFNYEGRDPYFRGISSATRGGGTNNLGSGSTQKTYSYSATLSLQKFLPRALGARLPVSFSYSKNTQIPLLRNRSDIVLPDEIRDQEKSVSETKSLRVSEAFQTKSKNTLLDILLNRQSVSFSYARTNQTSVNRPYYLGENYNMTASYDMSFRKPPTVPVFFWLKSIPLLKKAADSKLALFPNTWRWEARYNRSFSISDDISDKRTSSLSSDFNGTMNLAYRVFENLNMTYNYTTKRDLSDPDLVNIVFNPKKFRLGQETSYNQNFNLNYDPNLFKFVSTKWTYSAKYNEIYERSSKTKKSDLSQSWGVSGTFQHQTLLGGKSAGSSKRGPATRRNVRGGAGKKDEEKKPFYDPPLAALRFLTGWFEPISYGYNTSYRNSLPGMLERPSWKYRFGIDKEADVLLGSEFRTPSSGESEAYDFSSGFTLLGGLATDVKFKRSVSRDLVKQGSRTEKTSTGWPDLTIRIKQFTTLPLIKPLVNKFIDIFSPKTSYSRQVSEDYNIDSDFLLNHNETKSYSPLLQLNFKLFRALQFSGSYTFSRTNTEKYNPSGGNLQTETISEKRSMAFTAKYSFSAPGGLSIPLFGKLKFKSQVSIDLNVRKNANTVQTAQSGGAFVTSTDKSDFSVSPVISYTFSRQVKGGITARWQDSEDNYANRKSHVRELQIWAEIRF